MARGSPLMNTSLGVSKFTDRLHIRCHVTKNMSPYRLLKYNNITHDTRAYSLYKYYIDDLGR